MALRILRRRYVRAEHPIDQDGAPIEIDGWQLGELGRLLDVVDALCAAALVLVSGVAVRLLGQLVVGLTPSREDIGEIRGDR